ncbi:MAG: HAMP domain-containing protein [bacterium]
MKYRRRNYIINKKYQYGILVLLLSIVFIAIFVSILATHYFLLSSIVSKIDATGRAPTGQELIETSMKPLIIVVPIIFIILALTVICVVFISHRTAGPLYNLRQAMAQVGKGDLSVKIKFRKNDEIHDVAESFNDMVDALRKKYGEDKKIGS